MAVLPPVVTTDKLRKSIGCLMLAINWLVFAMPKTLTVTVASLPTVHKELSMNSKSQIVKAYFLLFRIVPLAHLTKARKSMVFVIATREISTTVHGGTKHRSIMS